MLFPTMESFSLPKTLTMNSTGKCIKKCVQELVREQNKCHGQTRGDGKKMGGKMTNMGITTLDAKYSLKYPLFISPKTIKINPISKVSFISPA